MGLLMGLFSLGVVAASLTPAVAIPGVADPVVRDVVTSWRYEDATYDGRRIVDVTGTQLDTMVDGRYRVRVFGRDFVKNQTDIVRIYLDTDGDRWPEFKLSWYLGKNPARPVQKMSLYSVRFFEWGRKTKLSCPRMEHRVDYAADVVAVLFSRACLGDVTHLRWAGFVASIYHYDAETNRFSSHQDQFPAFRRFPRDIVVEPRREGLAPLAG
jgi:hypothetical protein